MILILLKIWQISYEQHGTIIFPDHNDYCDLHDFQSLSSKFVCILYYLRPISVTFYNTLTEITNKKSSNSWN